MVADTYRRFWDDKARDSRHALSAVDGSPDEETARATGAWTARQVKLALDIGADDDVLEIGCGAGRIGRELAAHCRSWTGVDVSANMLSVAATRMRGLKNISLRRVSRSELSIFENASFQKAYSVAVFCHLNKEDVFLYLREMHRVLKPGGAAYYETWNLANPVAWKFWHAIVNAWQRSDSYPSDEVGRNQFSVPEETRLLTEKAGFELGACYTESPWIQMIAIRPGDAESEARFRDYVRSHRDEIANTPLWSELFERLLDVRLGGAEPADYLDWLKQQPPGRDVDLYRLFVARSYGLDP